MAGTDSPIVRSLALHANITIRSPLVRACICRRYVPDIIIITFTIKKKRRYTKTISISFTHSLTNTLTHSLLICSRTYPLIHSITHSSTHWAFDQCPATHQGQQSEDLRMDGHLSVHDATLTSHLENLSAGYPIDQSNQLLLLGTKHTVLTPIPPYL